MLLPSYHNQSPAHFENVNFDNNGEMGKINEDVPALLLSEQKQLFPLTQVMKFHTQYLDPFLRIHNFILKGDGPLSYSYRHYIAIMAAARHRCDFLVNIQREEFINCGGDEDWLLGIEHVPKKLRDLNEINMILAHQPWLLNKDHIEKLTKGNDSWSLSEVVQAIVLLSHFHALSSFVFSCGINDVETGAVEEHTKPANGHDDAIASNGSHPAPPGTSPAEGSVEALVKKMRTISEHKLSDATSPEELVRGFENVENQSVELGFLNSVQIRPPQRSDVQKYIEMPDFCYVDFARRRETSRLFPTFRIQDYSWDDHGFSLVNRFYSDVGNLLDEKFKVTYNLTYYTMGRKTDIDTSMFRRAIWNYIQCMYGIRHDDYDYREVNELLERDIKSYIKTVCCFPNHVARTDCDTVMREFRRSEKIHVNLMISEARIQAELLYALRSVMKYMT